MGQGGKIALGGLYPCPDSIFDAMIETLETRRKRLIHRSVYTGMKETDILLGAFARAHVPTFDAGQLDRYEHLLSAGDPVILDWVMARDTPPPEFESDVLNLLRNFRLTS